MKIILSAILIFFQLAATAQSNNKVTIEELIPIQNHFFKLSEISTIGPHKNRQTLAEIAIATILAVIATEMPFLVRK